MSTRSQGKGFKQIISKAISGAYDATSLLAHLGDRRHILHIVSLLSRLASALAFLPSCPLHSGKRALFCNRSSSGPRIRTSSLGGADFRSLMSKSTNALVRRKDVSSRAFVYSPLLLPFGLTHRPLLPCCNQNRIQNILATFDCRKTDMRARSTISRK